MIALALALAAASASADDELVERLGGPLGEQARAARRQLARASQRERAEWLARVRAPVPAGSRGVHPSWIEHALAELPQRARVALAAGGGDAVDVWLARWACAAIPPLPPIRAIDEPRSIDDVIAMAEPGEWLRAVGRAQLAYATSLAQPGAPRRDELGPARAVIARCRGGDEVAIGARAIAPLVDSLARRQLAVRLPRPLGLVVERELRAYAGEPIAHAPAWARMTR